MKKIAELPKLADMKKDARLTIRIPRELKDKIEGIDRLYGVALPKIANMARRLTTTDPPNRRSVMARTQSIGTSPDP